MKVIVTGGAGFIGSHIVDELLANGHTPFVIDNLSSGTRRNLPADVSVYEIDIRDTEKLAAVFDEVRPHGVCHQAAQISVRRSMREPIVDAEINVMGTLNVFDQAARTGAERIVFASSGGALYGEVSGPVMEDCPTHPQSAYGISKWVAEQYLEFYSRERQIKGIALRYSNVYGPRQNPHGEAGVVANFTKKMLSGESVTINGDGRYIRDYVYGPDVAQANVLALEKPIDKSFTAINIGTGIGVDVNELAAQLQLASEAFLLQTGRSLHIPPFQYGEPRRGDLRTNMISPTLADQVLRWKPKTRLTEGLQKTVRWFGDNSSE